MTMDTVNTMNTFSLAFLIIGAITVPTSFTGRNPCITQVLNRRDNRTMTLLSAFLTCSAARWFTPDDLPLFKEKIATAHRKYTETYSFNEEEWTTIYQMPHTLLISNKAKELHYKIVHGYVATNRLLHKMNIIDSDICDFCDQQEQTLCH